MRLDEGSDAINTKPGVPNGLTHLQEIKIPGFRRHHAPAAGGIKDRSPKFILYTLDPLSNGGLSDAKVFPSGFKGAFVCHREDGDLLVHCDPQLTHS